MSLANPQPQPNNTINSELDSILDELIASNSFVIRDSRKKSAKTAIEKWAAQEANKAREQAIIDATGGYAIPNLMNHQKNRNTAFKKYAIKFFNTKIKERREGMLAQLTAENRSSDHE